MGVRSADFRQQFALSLTLSLLGIVLISFWECAMPSSDIHRSPYNCSTHSFFRGSSSPACLPRTVFDSNSPIPLRWPSIGASDGHIASPRDKENVFTGANAAANQNGFYCFISDSFICWPKVNGEGSASGRERRKW